MAPGAWLEPSEALHVEVRALIDRCLDAERHPGPKAGLSQGAGPAAHELDAAVDALAMAIARYQAAHVPAVSALYAARGIDPAKLERAADIPALPCELFRLRRVAPHEPAQDERCFRTSGTTQGTSRGEHPLRTTGSYARAALGWAERMLWPDGRRLRLLSLVAAEQHAADSSLSFMVSRFGERLDLGPEWFFDGERLDVDRLAEACGRAQARGEAALVCTTALALCELSDRLGAERLPLPAGSRVMQTGGFKGRSREIAPAELRSLAAALFALPESHVIGEYGMTELSSQLYEGTLCRALGFGFESAEAGRYYPPPWLQVTAVDPETFVPLRAGGTGLCQLLDLCNVDSSLGVLTSDRCRRHADGSIELLGRMPGAEPRGCSLGVEAALAAAAGPEAGRP